MIRQSWLGLLEIDFSSGLLGAFTELLRAQNHRHLQQRVDNAKRVASFEAIKRG
jgi:hypothetical protein